MTTTAASILNTQREKCSSILSIYPKYARDSEADDVFRLFFLGQSRMASWSGGAWVAVRNELPAATTIPQTVGNQSEPFGGRFPARVL